jgi:3-(3-hydroxy-phenyl)propionate hydroxylase
MHTYDVLVVGYGPVGGVLAARLGAHGVRVLVVERDSAPFPLPRAVAADDEVAFLLAQTAPGLLDGMLADRPVRFLDRRQHLIGTIAFPPGPHGQPGLTLFHQPTLEARLRRHVAGLPGVEVRLGTAVNGWSQDRTGVTAALSDGSSARARWLVGCDGAGSTVRRLAGIDWLGHDLPHEWLVADVTGRVSDRRGFTYTCDPALPRVDMPVPGGHRWEWLLRSDAQARQPTGRDVIARDLIARDLIARDLIARDVDPDTVEVVRAVRYRFGARRAAPGQGGRVLLAGDAAHTMPPFAGQGLGAGVRDAWSLAWRLAADDPAGYQAERLPHVRQMTRLSLLVGAVLQTGAPPLAALRDGALRSAFQAPLLGPWLARGGPRRTASGVWEASLSGPSS